MSKTSLISITILVIVFIGGLFALANFGSKPNQIPIPAQGLTEKQAKQIAQKTCIKGGETMESGIYNEITKTWWFNANLNATKDGCNPACVVSEETKTAEINWRCTGLLKNN